MKSRKGLQEPITDRHMPKLVRITTVPLSLLVLLKKQMRFMKEQGFDVTMISSDGKEVAPLLEQEGCPHIAVEMTRKITPWKDLMALIKLTMILRRIRPEIVHTHTPKAGLIGMWAAKLAGVPIRLHTIAGLPWMETRGMMRFILKSVEKITAAAASQIMPNSMVQRSFLQQEGIALNKMKVLGHGSSNGINTEYYSVTDSLKEQAKKLREDSATNPGAFIWFFVGRVVKEKGIQELMLAFDRLFKEYPDNRLWIIGNEEPELDPLDPAFRKWLTSHPGIYWWGYQTDVRPFMAASDALVFPSYREGFPNVPLQAGSMGCTLILSDINGCNEIVENRKDGLLVPVKNVDALYEAMLFVRNNPALAKQMQDAIMLKIRSYYDQATLWKILLEEYHSWLKIAGKA